MPAFFIYGFELSRQKKAFSITFDRPFDCCLLNEPLTCMLILENHPLKDLNTFRIAAYAKSFVRISTTEELLSVIDTPSFRESNHLILGGGSNVLFASDFDGMVVQQTTGGRHVLDEKGGKIFLKVLAGEPWDELVAYCVENGWGGLENLSLIPGHAGSSPIQNIGAYGTELREHFHSLEAADKKTREIKTFTASDCRFGYRHSFFKGDGRNRYIIMSVTFALDSKPVVRTHYGELDRELKNKGIKEASIADVREAVCNIRKRKLPDPCLVGNAGSFFKNPVVSTKQYHRLKKDFPDIVAYPEQKGIKLAAGWLIEQTGWKGFRRGDAGVHDKQALVLVNHQHATGKDILQLATDIQQSVRLKFGVSLQPEVTII